MVVNKMRFFLLIIVSFFVFSCKTEPNVNTTKVNTTSSPQNEKSEKKVAWYDYEVINVYKHDPKAFTQGLVFHNGFLYESTGNYGSSSLRKVELESGKVLQKFDLPDNVFAEGMTILNDKIYQISWKEGTAWRYNLEDFKIEKEFRYQGEGWGLTHDGTNLIMSDGSPVIRFINPETFETVKKIAVFKENGEPLVEINELEWVKGEIWANVWHKTEIARIDPESGKIKGWIDFTKMAMEETRGDSEYVLNGIAYDEKTDRIFITGKKWKSLFEVKIKEKN